ncbi:ERF family protein [Patescibacteria group bacterium]|nr:ERF family protein [Patescibacteria group bacterium]
MIPKAISEAIVKVMSLVTYVENRGKNNFHNYKYAKAGDLFAKLQPAMAEAGLVIVPDLVGYKLIANDTIMEANFNFTLAHSSGDTWRYKPHFIGMSSCRNQKGGFDDKALNKCLTAARKYFLISLFNVPTGDDPDPDADGDTKSEPKHEQPRQTETKPEPTPEPEPERSEFDVVLPFSEEGRPDWKQWTNTLFPLRIAACESTGEVQNVIDGNKSKLDTIKQSAPKTYERLKAGWDHKIDNLLNGVVDD